MAEDKICAVDATWLLHRAHHSKSPHQVTMIVNWICGYVISTRSTHLAVCFDTGKSFRYDLYKDYKANRHKLIVNEPTPVAHPHDYYEELVRTLENLRIPVVTRLRMEADDLLATIGKQAPRSVLVTKDKDQLQCISETCDVLQPGVMGNPDVLLTLKSFQADRGLTPAQFLDVQTLMGDKVDNIPQLITPAKARNIVLQHGSVKAWINSADTPDKELLSRVLLNRKLVKMLTDCIPGFDMRDFVIPKGQSTKIVKYQEMVNSKKSLFGF